MAEQQKQMQFGIDDGPTFFSDEISITSNPQRFFLDFKNTSPRVDVRSNEFLPIAIKHSVIMLDPGLAKVFAKLLSEHVERYERDHGKIPELPQAPPRAKPQITSTDERPGYFG